METTERQPQKKGSLAPLSRVHEPVACYLHDPGNHLETDPAQVQVWTELLLAFGVGVNVTTKSTAPPPFCAISPETVITPVRLPTSKALAYLVGENVAPPQLADKLRKPTVCTCSLTQVRAPLAAKMISDALARLV